MTILSLPGRHHANPYFPLFCRGLEDAGVGVLNIRDRAAKRLRFDVLHVHFPTHFLTETHGLKPIVYALGFSAFFLLMKLLRKPIVYSIHDVVPFNPRRAWLVVPYRTLLHRLCDAYVFMNESSQRDFYARYPGQRAKRFVAIPLGPYPVTLAPAARARALRDGFAGAADALVVGFLGGIHAHKGLETLPLLPRRLRDGREVRVVVAGAVAAGYRQAANAILGAMPDGSVVRIDAKPTDAELDELVQATDAVLLAHTRGWNSSAAMLVLSNRRRLIASSLPMFADLERLIGPPWVERYGGDSDDEIAATLAAALERVAAAAPRQTDDDALSRFLDASSVARGSATLRSLYAELVAKAKRVTVPA